MKKIANAEERNAFRIEACSLFNENNKEGLSYLRDYCDNDQIKVIDELVACDTSALGGKELESYNQRLWNLLNSFGIIEESRGWAIPVPVAVTSNDRNLGAGDIVIHFKNTMNPADSPAKYMYEIVSTAKHTETGEQMMVYRSLLDKNKVFARPYDMFMSKTDKNKYPTATQEYRLEKVSNLGDILEFEGIEKYSATYLLEGLNSYINDLMADDVPLCNYDILSEIKKFLSGLC